MRLLFAAARAAAGILGLVAVIVTFAVTASRGPINPFNFFGYFTLQSNIGFAIVMLALAVDGFANRRQSELLLLTRGCVATYMIIVGLVYNTLLTGLEGGVTVVWANIVLHVVVPIYALVDWLFFGDRPPLPWKRYWIVLVYPVVWLVVVLIRVGTDGMSFYPFLNFNDPKLGGGGVALYCVVIAIGFAAFGALIWVLSRVRILKGKDAVETA
ncbi:MAG TPA: Pr6Pr family membrane protein [Galbitalea sp.]